MFCTSWSVAVFVLQKRFQQFHISFRFLFQVLAFEVFQVIFDRSIVINKPFLVHVFKLQHLRKLKISLKKWNTASRMKIILYACYGSYIKRHDTLHQIGRIVLLARKKVIRAIWLATAFLDQLVNRIYFAPFQWVSLSTYIINMIYTWDSYTFSDWSPFWNQLKKKKLQTDN